MLHTKIKWCLSSPENIRAWRWWRETANAYLSEKNNIFRTFIRRPMRGSFWVYIQMHILHVYTDFYNICFCFILHSLRPQQSNSVALDRTQVWQYVSTNKPGLISACISNIRRFSQVAYLSFFLCLSNLHSSPSKIQQSFSRLVGYHCVGLLFLDEHYTCLFRGKHIH